MARMRRSTREIEIKLPFDSPAAARESILQLSATEYLPRCFEDNIVLDLKTRSLENAHSVLRLRRSGDEATLTLKSPVPGPALHKVRDEHEITVSDFDEALSILGALGFTPRWRYQKYRTVFRLGELVLCLDETPLGCYVELEGPPEAIDRAAARLGFDPAHYVRESYAELWARETARRGSPLTDMVLGPGGAAR